MSTGVTRDDIGTHRIIATQVETLYWTIETLAKKKPTESITPLMAKKINHVIVEVRGQVSDDAFLDAIETVPVDPNEQVRFDEALILLAELRSVLDRQWGSDEYGRARELFDIRHVDQTI